MARKVQQVTIQAVGRDNGKVFVLTELPTDQSEKWAFRLFLALAASGVDVPGDIQSMGMAGFAMLGIKALGGVKWELAEPLIDEMFTCVKIMPNPSAPQTVRALIPDDIEEIATRLMLRKQILGLHVDFSTAAAQLNG